MELLQTVFHRIRSVIHNPEKLWHPLKQFAFYLVRRWQYGKINVNVVIKDSRMIKNRDHIYFEGSAFIMPNCRIEPVLSYENSSYNPSVIIGNNVSINQSLHLTCANHITIGNHTNIAAFVTITDISHPYEDITIPIKNATLKIGEVTIGEGCEIYNGAVILPNVHIGNHCVIGANSIVSCDIPDFSVAVGAPARIVKRYSIEKESWLRVDKNGNFISE